LQGAWDTIFEYIFNKISAIKTVMRYRDGPQKKSSGEPQSQNKAL